MPAQTDVEVLERTLDASPAFTTATAELAVSGAASAAASPRLAAPPGAPFVAAPARVESSAGGTGDLAVPAGERFTSWSRRYVNALGLGDALIGAVAVLVPARFSTNLTEGWLAPYLIPLAIIAAAIWPLAIFLMRGYNRASIGVGSDEPRAVIRAGVALVVAAAFPTVWFHNQTLLTLLVVAVPFAVLLSIGGRLAARKLLHRRQRNGQDVRHVVIAGSATAARELCAQLSREPHCGMRVIGVCLPTNELAQLSDIGAPI
ncbi:MAG TPA: hypothetical protein VFU98_10215, partial [Microlunatus sp.]|nr:hypothetical protein [Microlunatus sp.]